MRGFLTLRDGLTGHHVLAVLLCFFGLMAIANGFFVYFAVGTFNGFEARDAYRRGLAYNIRVAADEAQGALGWQTTSAYDRASRILKLQVSDASGTPVAGLTSRGRIGRPVTNREDREFVLRESASGLYEAQLALAPGQWVLAAELFTGAGAPAYRVKQRLWVKEGP